MKILVQNCLNHTYLQSHTQWTSKASEAKTFPSSERAMAYCARHQIPAVQIVLKFEPDRYNITVPITKECADGADSQKTLLN